jgi:hypothetical protein
MFDSYATALYSPPHSDAGWSSLVARRAHNPKVVGSNPAPATIYFGYSETIFKAEI